MAIMAMLLVAKFPASAKPPDIASVPQNIPTADQTALNQRSARLHAWHDELKTKAEGFNNRAVPKEAEGYAVYQRDKAKLDSEIGTYAAAVTKFNEAVAKMAQKWVEPLEAHIQRLQQQIASDQEALRQLRMDKNAKDFEEWAKLTDDARSQFINETLRILGGLAVDEMNIALQDKALPLASAFNKDEAKTKVKLLEHLGIDNPDFLTAVQTLGDSTTKKERMEAAKNLVNATSVVIKGLTVADSNDKLKATIETACETMGTLTWKKQGLVSWQTRTLVAGAEMTAELGFAFTKQHIARETITSLDHMTEEQLKGVKSVSALLKTHVKELQEAKQASN